MSNDTGQAERTVVARSLLRDAGVERRRPRPGSRRQPPGAGLRRRRARSRSPSGRASTARPSSSESSRRPTRASTCWRTSRVDPGRAQPGDRRVDASDRHPGRRPLRAARRLRATRGRDHAAHRGRRTSAASWTPRGARASRRRWRGRTARASGSAARPPRRRSRGACRHGLPRGLRPRDAHAGRACSTSASNADRTGSSTAGSSRPAALVWFTPDVARRLPPACEPARPGATVLLHRALARRAQPPSFPTRGTLRYFAPPVAGARHRARHAARARSWSSCGPGATPWLLLGFAAPIAYAAIVLLASIVVAGRDGVRTSLWMLVVLPCIHFCWGTGFVLGYGSLAKGISALHNPPKAVEMSDPSTAGTGPRLTPPRTIAELRAVAQPPEVRARKNAEHWTADLYLRDLSPYVTWLLLRTSISANGVTGLMILTGWATAAALLIPGFGGACPRTRARPDADARRLLRR